MAIQGEGFHWVERVNPRKPRDHEVTQIAEPPHGEERAKSSIASSKDRPKSGLSVGTITRRLDYVKVLASGLCVVGAQNGEWV